MVASSPMCADVSMIYTTNQRARVPTIETLERDACIVRPGYGARHPPIEPLEETRAWFDQGMVLGAGQLSPSKRRGHSRRGLRLPAPIQWLRSLPLYFYGHELTHLLLLLQQLLLHR